MFNLAVKTFRPLGLVLFCSLAACSSGSVGKTADGGEAGIRSAGGTSDADSAGLGGVTATGGTTAIIDGGAAGGSGTGGTAGVGGSDVGVAGRTGAGGKDAGAAGMTTEGGRTGSGGMTGVGGGDAGVAGRTGTGGRDAGVAGMTAAGGRTGSGGMTGVGGGDAGTGGAAGILDAGRGGSDLRGDTAPGDGGGGSSVPAGWLYTLPKDNKIYLSNGSGGTAWMGRGVNIDDLFLCGYNNQLQMTNPTGEAALLGIVSNLMADWKPTLLRTSLGMNSYAVVSWLASSAYKTAMTNVINKIGTYPGVYVLLTVRSDTTMVNTDGSVCGQGDDAVCLPSTATDDVYREVVASFASAPFVIFGVANEPGGMSAKDATLSSLMSHAVSVIRAAEDALGVPHHLVAVQGNQWTSKIGFYNTAPLPYDNVVYEYHSYPPEATGTYGYTQSSIPVIIGEYGPLNSDQSFLSAFLTDVEAKQIPNIAWSVSPYSDCAPDLVSVTHTTTLNPNTWGAPIKQYLTSR